MQALHRKISPLFALALAGGCAPEPETPVVYIPFAKVSAPAKNKWTRDGQRPTRPTNPHMSVTCYKRQVKDALPAVHPLLSHNMQDAQASHTISLETTEYGTSAVVDGTLRFEGYFAHCSLTATDMTMDVTCVQQGTSLVSAQDLKQAFVDLDRYMLQYSSPLNTPLSYPLPGTSTCTATPGFGPR